VAGRGEHGVGPTVLERAVRCESAKLGCGVLAGECGTISPVGGECDVKALHQHVGYFAA
jgi:hypothetical protein